MASSAIVYTLNTMWRLLDLDIEWFCYDGAVTGPGIGYAMTTKTLRKADMEGTNIVRRQWYFSHDELTRMRSDVVRFPCSRSVLRQLQKLLQGHLDSTEPDDFHETTTISMGKLYNQPR